MYTLITRYAHFDIIVSRPPFLVLGRVRNSRFISNLSTLINNPQRLGIWLHKKYIRVLPEPFRAPTLKKSSQGTRVACEQTTMFLSIGISRYHRSLTVWLRICVSINSHLVTFSTRGYLTHAWFHWWVWPWPRPWTECKITAGQRTFSGQNHNLSGHIYICMENCPDETLI